MSFTVLWSFVFFTAFYFCSTNVFAQKTAPDSNYVLPFKKQNVIEAYSGIYKTHLEFANPLVSRRDFRLVANSSVYTGIYINYKWLMFQYSWAVPGTRLDNNINLKYNALEFRFGTRQISFHPFYQSYNGLLFQRNRKLRHYEPFRDLQYTAIGMDFSYFLNSKKFSFNAANSFSKQQIKSAGSVFILATPQWQKLKWNNPGVGLIGDSITRRLLRSNPSWVSLTALAGYNYNFAIEKGKFNIAPAVAAGGGILKELNRGKNSLQPVFRLQAWVNAGYNGPLIYAYFNAKWHYEQTRLLIKNLHKTNMDMSVTMGYRFGNMKKKLIGIL